MGHGFLGMGRGQELHQQLLYSWGLVVGWWWALWWAGCWALWWAGVGLCGELLLGFVVGWCCMGKRVSWMFLRKSRRPVVRETFGVGSKLRAH